MSYIVQGIALFSLVWLLATGVKSAIVMTPDYPLGLRLAILSPAFSALVFMAAWTRTFDMYNPLETWLLLAFAFTYHKASDRLHEFLEMFHLSELIHPRKESRLAKYLHSRGEHTDNGCHRHAHD